MIDFRLPRTSLGSVSSIVSFINVFELKYYEDKDDEEMVQIKSLELLKNKFNRTRCEELIMFVNIDLCGLFKSATNDPYYFYDCSYSLYKNSYQIRLKRFLKNYEDSNELDFLTHELYYLKNPDLHRTLCYEDVTINYHNYVLTNFHFDIAHRRKIEFVNSKMRERDINLKYNDSIFRNRNAQDWFYDTLVELNAVDSNQNVLNGFQAKCHAILNNKDCKDLIFKYDLKLLTYIDFLNEGFGAEIKTKNKLSDGSKHEVEVSNLMDNYIKALPQNKSE